MFKKYDAYKDSGVEWLGDIPANWITKKLKFLADIRTGNKNTEDKRSSGIYPFYVRSQTPEKINSYSFDGEAILTAGDGAGVGKVYHYVNGRFDYHQRVYKFSDFKNIAGKLLYYYLVSNFYNVAILGTAKSTVDSLRLPLIQDFIVTYPKDSGTQKKIVNFLDQKTSEIDQAIALKEKQIALLNERKQIVIQKAVTQGLDPNVPMKDSGVDGVSQIPKHWETYFNRRLFRENSRPVRGDELPLSLSQKDGVIPSGEMKEKSLSPAHRNNFKLCFPNDLVVNRFKGHLGVFFQSNYTGIVTFHYGVFEPAKNVYTKYFELLYHTEQYKTLYAGASNGMSIGLQNLSNLNFYRIKSIVPPLEEQKLICEYADKVENEHNNLIHKLESQIEKLKEYKTTLINDAVTGKIKVA